MAGQDTWRVNTDADGGVYVIFEKRKVESPPTGIIVSGFAIRVDSRVALDQALRAGRGDGMCSFIAPGDTWSVHTDEQGVSLRVDERSLGRPMGIEGRIRARQEGLWRQPVLLGKDEAAALAEALGAGRGQGTCSIAQGGRERQP